MKKDTPIKACEFQPPLHLIPIEELMEIYKKAKLREQMIGAILRTRIYEIEKRTK